MLFLNNDAKVRFFLKTAREEFKKNMLYNIK